MEDKPMIIAIITRIQLLTFSVIKTAPITREIIIPPIPNVAIYRASIRSDRKPARIAEMAIAAGVPKIIEPVWRGVNSNISCRKNGS